MSERNKLWWSANKSPETIAANNAASNRARRKDPIRALLNAIKWRATQTGIEFSLSSTDIVVPARCPVLDIALTHGLGFGKGISAKEKDQRASVDRIDNSRGYVPDNVVVVSFRANRIKSDATLDEMRRIVAFYDSLSRERASKCGLSSELDGGLQEVQVSPVQPSPQKETRPLPLYHY